VKRDSAWLNWLIGLGLLGSAVTGLLGLIAALILLIAGQVVAAAVCLTAAALSFGLMANAILRQ
jgi:hypothetical protein